MSGRQLILWLMAASTVAVLGAITGQGVATATPGVIAAQTDAEEPTPSPEPSTLKVLCHPVLTFSDPTPTVGDTIDVTFTANCGCAPTDVPDARCGFGMFELSQISARGFSTPNTPIGPPAPDTVQLTATTAGLSRVTLTYRGENSVSPPGLYRWTTRSASNTIDVQEGAQTSTVTVAESCLAGSGRVDVNILNDGSEPAQYTINFSGLRPREVSVAPGDWARVPFSGRLDGQHPLVVLRDGDLVHDETIRVTCDEETPAVSSPEVAVINACRNGLGYLLFQIVNPTGSPRDYVVEFESVRNRSTTAAEFGQAVRAVSGRADNDYNWTVRSSRAVVSSGTVTVSCN